MFRNRKVVRESNTSRKSRLAAGQLVDPSAPPMSYEQNQQYSAKLATAGVVGAAGCTYTGYTHGIQCNYTENFPSYARNVDSFASKWGDNIHQGFPAPHMKSPGGYPQIMMGGGSGSPECAADCSCVGDPDCTCRGANGLACGYMSVNQSCVEPVPGGTYTSLSACEAANARGNFKL